MGAAADERVLESQARYLAEQDSLDWEGRRCRTAAARTEVATSSQLTFWKVAFAVLVGNLMTALVGALLYALSRA